MTAYFYDRRVSDHEFRQYVRRFAPSSLIPRVAATAAAYPTPKEWLASPFRKFTPWALAEIARTSLVFGNEHRAPASEDSVLRACAAYSAISDPELHSQSSDAFWKFMVRVSYEQLPDQASVLNELSRSIALYNNTESPRVNRVLLGDWHHAMLGCTISEYVSIAFLFHVGAVKNAGTFDLEWLTEEQFAEITRGLTESVIRDVADRQFIASVEQFRSLEQQHADRLHPDLRRHTFNPLQSRPILKGLSETLIIPSPGMLIRKASPLGIYYAGMAKWGQQFAIETGYLFEEYVGQQLGLSNADQVLPAVTYGKDKRESVDWFALFETVTLLVEVKSTRSTEAVRLAADSAGADLQRQIGKAVSQLNVTENLIQGQHPDFSSIPKDRPRVGLIVTMEPFHIVNSAYMRGNFPAASVPYVICGAAELEDIVTCTSASVGQVLLTHVQDPSKDGWSVRSAFEGERRSQNPILHAAWDMILWGSQGQRHLRDANEVE